jgi:hypothetical protein
MSITIAWLIRLRQVLGSRVRGSDLDAARHFRRTIRRAQAAVKRPEVAEEM